MPWLIGLLPCALLCLGVPIYLIFLATTVVALWSSGLPATIMPQTMFGSIDSFTLLAVPFFLFAGELMGRGGIAVRLVHWVTQMFGSMRGSLGLATVVSCEIFGTMSGSSPATVAAIGRLMYPALRQSHYEEKFALGLITSTGAIATVIPPSILMIVYGAAAEVSIAKLFLGGFLPGMLIGLLMAAYVLWYARRHALTSPPRFRWPAFATASLEALWALGVPFVILGGIYSGVFTPTEAAGIAGVYGILVSTLVYKDMGWRGIWDVAVNAGVVTAQLMIIVAGSAVFTWYLTVSGVPQAITAYIQSLHAPRWGLLCAINGFLIIVGGLIDPTSATLVLTPLLLPMVKAVGVDPVHFGIILTVNLSMGMFTPPFALNIFMAQALFGAPTSVIYPGLVPFILIQVLALICITYIPEIAMLLPRLF
jgi:C4-dicarboxylate transporter DctM subunit